ncbi:MAG: tetratricopeptide repeat protein, partial [Gemmatimonadetes bacterium]|nr:tetratricopeptide repeat protein [Gemmatimonadota bacterium]
CMKCLDCVDTCPRDALRFGFGAPSLGAASKRPPAARHWDVSGPTELMLALVFAATFFAWRGAYDAIPFLMAVGLAACTTFVAWLFVRLLRRGDVSLQGKVLVESGRWRPAGRVALAASALLLVLGLQTGAVRLLEAAGARADRGVTVGRAEAFAAQRPPLPPDVRAHAERAAARYRLADRIGEGGLGLGSTPSVTARRAWLALVLGDPEEATRQLRRLMDRSPERTTVLDLARVRRAAGDAPGAVAVLNGLVAEDPTDTDAHRELAATWMAAGDHAKALAELVIVTNLAPDDRVAAHLRDQLRARVENEPAP